MTQNKNFKDTTARTLESRSAGIVDASEGMVPEDEFITPIQSGTIGVGGTPFGTSVVGNYAYVSSGDADSLEAIDIGDIGDMTSASTVSTTETVTPGALDYKGDHVYVTGRDSNSLAVIDISDPENLSQAGSVVDATDLGTAIDVVVQGDHAFVVAQDGALTAVDISDPTAPSIAATLSMDDTPERVGVQGDLAYVTDSVANSLTVIDVSDPTDLSQVGSVTDGTDLGGATGVSVRGPWAYVACFDSGNLATVDISEPAAPAVEATASAASPANAVAIRGDYAYVSGFGTGFVDISDPTAPESMSPSISLIARQIVARGNFLYGANLTANELQVFGGGTARSEDPTEFFSYDPGMTNWANGLSNEEVNRIQLQGSETLTVKRIEFRQKGGGSSSDASFQVRDATDDTVLASQTLGGTTEDPDPGESGGGNLVLVELTNSTGSAIDAAPRVIAGVE